MEKIYLVSDLMTSEPVTADPDTSLNDVMKLMVNNKIRRIPIVDDKKRPVGIISDRDLRLVIDSPFLKTMPQEKTAKLANYKARETMRTALIVIEETATVTEAAKKVHKTHIGSLLVTNTKGELSGILSRADLIDHLIQLLDPATIMAAASQR